MRELWGQSRLKGACARGNPKGTRCTEGGGLGCFSVVLCACERLVAATLNLKQRLLRNPS